MLELNDLAFQNADILIALDEGPNGLWSSKRDLARHVGRDESNLNKTLKRLVEAKLLDEEPLAGLTEAGREQLEAILRARNPLDGASRGARGRSPLDSFRPNPANRPVTEAAVRVVADTIEAVGDVVQPVETLPADANGVRTILDGEHRWRAVQLLATEGRLPLALADGLPFQEREATDAEQILIRIVTASARADLTPLDDARQLLALQEATGWSAREIAKKTGRSPADSDTGVRDVQVKIKVAREASEEALAAYERDRGWDALRDSVTKPKPPTEPLPHGRAEEIQGSWSSHLWDLSYRSAPPPDLLRHEDPACARLPDLIRPGQLLRTSYGTGPFKVTAVTPDLHYGHAAWTLALSHVDRPHGQAWINELLVEWEGETPHFRKRFKACDDEIFLIDAADQATDVEPTPADVAILSSPTRTNGKPTLVLGEHRKTDGTVGWGWRWEGDLAEGTPRAKAPTEFLPNSELARARVIDVVRQIHRASMTVELVRWLDSLLGPHYVDGVNCFNASNAGERRRSLGWEKRQSNSGGGGLKAALQTLAEEAKAAPPPADEAPGARALAAEDPDSDGLDAWGRDHNGVVADRAVLIRIEDFFAGRSGQTDPAWPRRLMAEAVGLEAPFEVDGDCSVLATPAAALQPMAVLTADVGAAWPPERARALALMVAWALNKTFGEVAR